MKCDILDMDNRCAECRFKHCLQLWLMYLQQLQNLDDEKRERASGHMYERMEACGIKDILIDLGWLYVVLTYFVIVGSSNAVNLTDGLDGLAIMPAGAATLCGSLRALAPR